MSYGPLAFPKKFLKTNDFSVACKIVIHLRIAACPHRFCKSRC